MRVREIDQFSSLSICSGVEGGEDEDSLSSSGSNSFDSTGSSGVSFGENSGCSSASAPIGLPEVE